MATRAIVIGILLCLTALNARAEWYATIGAGIANHRMEEGDGHWVQENLAHTMDTTSPTYSLGFGNRISDRFSLEGTYHDLGSMSGALVYVSDEGYASCKCNPGEDWRRAYYQTDVKALAFTGLIDVGPLIVRAGMYYSYSNANIYVFTPDYLGGDLWHSVDDAYNQRAWRPVYGIGGRFGKTRVEAMTFRGANGVAAPNHHVYTLTISREF